MDRVVLEYEKNLTFEKIKVATELAPLAYN
jgi:hypothetical protein